MSTMLGRDNRITDASLIGHTVHSATFFASTTIIALAAGSLLGPVGAWLHLVGGAMAPVVDVMRQPGAGLQPRVGGAGSTRCAAS